MKKLFLALAFAVGVSFAANAQVSDDVKGVVKPEAQKQQEQLYVKVREALNGNVKGNKSALNAIAEDPQFLFEAAKVEVELGSKALKPVFVALSKTGSNKFIFEPINAATSDVKNKMAKDGVKVIKNVYVISTVAELRTITGDNKSDARYSVKLTWEVTAPLKNNKEASVNGELVKTPKVTKVKLVASEAQAIAYLQSEVARMTAMAKEKVRQWFRAPKVISGKELGLDKEVIGAFAVVGEIHSGKTIRNDKVFNMNESSHITLPLNPNQFIDPSKAYQYVNPEASVEVAPKFTVEVNADMTKAEITKVEYQIIAVSEPKTQAEIVNAVRNSKAFAEEYVAKVAEYAVSRDKAAQEEILAMFENPESGVDVTFRYKNGKERMNKSIPAKKYLSRIKGLEMEAKVEFNGVQENNWNTIVLDMCQKFRSKTYGDTMQKRIYIKKVDGAYKIAKIEAVEESTKRLEE